MKDFGIFTGVGGEWDGWQLNDISTGKQAFFCFVFSFLGHVYTPQTAEYYLVVLSLVSFSFFLDLIRSSGYYNTMIINRKHEAVVRNPWMGESDSDPLWYVCMFMREDLWCGHV